MWFLKDYLARVQLQKLNLKFMGRFDQLNMNVVSLNNGVGFVQSFNVCREDVLG